MTETPPPAASPAAPLTAENDKLWALLSHVGNILSVLPPLIIWLVLKDRGPRVAVEGKEATNWGINVTAALIVGNIVEIVLLNIPIIGWLIGLLLALALWALWLVNIVFAIMGAVKVSNGGSYQYPINIRWIK